MGYEPVQEDLNVIEIPYDLQPWVFHVSSLRYLESGIALRIFHLTV